jgi:hypothetical protein
VTVTLPGGLLGIECAPTIASHMTGPVELSTWHVELLAAV